MTDLCTSTARWRVHPPDEQGSRRLAQEFGVSPILGQLLINRGFTTSDASNAFLRPQLSDLAHPKSLHHMDRATARIAEAFKKKERVLVYGDYDVDGVTGTTLMLDFLRLGGLDPVHYIPCRLTEGYGFSSTFVENIGDFDPDLIISIDNGITSLEPIEAIRAHNTDVIVTDHHEPLATLPNANALVNPKLSDPIRGSHDLCGAAVAYKTAWAVADRLSPGKRVSPEFRNFLIDALSLVALGTICDAVPLLDDNRVLARFGLRALAHTKKPGLRALLDLACPGDKSVTEEDVGFRIGPRINAAGRMGHANRAVELLTSQDLDHAFSIARELDAVNRKRKETEQTILQEAKSQLLTQEDSENQSVLVLAGQGWHAGVVGIVAARIAETYGRPAILIALNGDRGRGSARSIHGVHLLDIIREGSEHLLRFGGHAFAAGLEIRTDQIDAFRRTIQVAGAAAVAQATEMGAPVAADLEVEFSQLSISLVDQIRQLAPFGQKNPAPVFLATGVEVMGEPRIVGGNNRHLSLYLRHRDTVLRGIGFNLAHHYHALLEKRPFSILLSPKINTFRGRTSLELQIHDLSFD